ncbi:uncharacterized protein TRIADDRAFT_20725, partial [Trichoplax adhaerens]
GKIVTMGWSYSEELICILDAGIALVFDLFGTQIDSIHLGQEAKEMKIVDAKLFLHDNVAGIVVLTTNYRFYTISNIQNKACRRCQDPPGLDFTPSSWVVLCIDRSTKIVIAINTDLYLSGVADIVKLQLQGITGQINYNSITLMATSTSYKYISLITDTGHLWIGSTDFRNCYGIFDTNTQTVPLDMIWCGAGAVVLNWGDELQIVGPHPLTVQTLPLIGSACLTADIDGVRIVTTDTHELLHEVPLETEEVFKVGSAASGAMLLDAMKEYEKGSSKADEYVRIIKTNGTLGDAIEQCIKVAGLEYDPLTQRMLLKAASFGKSFMDQYSPQSFVNMSQILRILNNIRHYKIGIPITLKQFEYLTLPVLIDRLILREHYALALHICDYLRIPGDEGKCRILSHWACKKVKQKNTDDKDIAKAIANKLNDVTGISYATIAAEAKSVGRYELAIKLLDFEPRANEQVPLLMKMKKEDIALNKAIESGDSDLIYMAIFHLKGTLQLGEFFRTIHKMPVALKLFEKYCREINDHRLLMDVAKQFDDFQKAGIYVAQSSYKTNNAEDRIDKLNEAARAFSAADRPICKRSTEDQINLLRLQSVMETDLGQPFVEMSLNETAYQLIFLGRLKLADKLKKDFKIPDRRYWWIKIRALAQSRSWDELERFSKSKKSPIGYEPFVDACINSHKNATEACKYIERVPLSKQAKCYIKIGLVYERISVYIHSQ